MPNNRYPKQCYFMLKAHYEIGRFNWLTTVKKLLCTSGFGYAWFSQGVGNVKYFITLFKQRISDCSFQYLQENKNSSSRCDLYKHSFFVKSREISVG